MENMERFTPLYAIAYAIMNSIENLSINKEGYFHILVFYALLYKRNGAMMLTSLLLDISGWDEFCQATRFHASC